MGRRRRRSLGGDAKGARRWPRAVVGGEQCFPAASGADGGNWRRASCAGAEPLLRALRLGSRSALVLQGAQYYLSRILAADRKSRGPAASSFRRFRRERAG